MGRPKKRTNKIYTFDNFYIDIDVYKKDVVHFKIRFDYKQEGDINLNVSKLKKEVENQFRKEYQYLERSRHIFDIEMAEIMKQRTGRCSLNGYFLIFDDYEEFVLQHAQELMKNIQTLFNQMELSIILPTNKNKYTKTY